MSLSGIAAIPLLLVKLWSVYPKLFAATPLGSPALAAATWPRRPRSRVLVAPSIFQLATGLANAAQWYPWSFSFRATHYAVAWIAIGALAVHIAVKLPIIRRALDADLDCPSLDRADGRPSRAGRPVAAFCGRPCSPRGSPSLAAAGNTVPWLRRSRSSRSATGEGPQGVPINRSAVAAGVLDRSAWTRRTG